MAFDSYDRYPRKRGLSSPLRWVIGIFIVITLVGGYYVYRYFFSPSSGRWAKYWAWRQDPASLSEYMLQPGERCGEAPFAFPTTGVIFGLWDQSYRPGHRHQGLDIFSGTEPGVTPVYVAYPGYLSRLPDWVSTVIIRVPSDPLEPGRQIWTYYTHMADKDGTSFISPELPPGSSEVFVEAGTFLGYQGDYSGNPDNPTGLHLHFSIVKDDGKGSFLNELLLRNTLDPSLYFNLPVNHNDNPDSFPLCVETVTVESWELVAEHE